MIHFRIIISIIKKIKQGKGIDKFGGGKMGQICKTCMF